MLFNSFAFLAFAAVVIPLYFVLSHRWQNRMLLVASYVFYGSWDYRFLGLLLISTLVDYGCGIGLSSQDGSRRRRKVLLWASMVTNLGILGFFKYFDFFTQSCVELLSALGFNSSLPVLQVVLPVGISFYTFQSMAYTIDVYRRRQEAHRDFVEFALYVAYFPRLVAGPIERSQRLLTQIARPRRVDWKMLSTGTQLIVVGLLKKIAIADAIAPYVESAFAAPGGHSSVFLLISLYLFAIQIYCDFSGYSDIARGVSRILGIELMINFRQPYLARNITDFWRRWHISLSSWLRDYLYIPLGGNRKGTLFTYRNLMITMLLGGLWHGAFWNFVVWGGLHGVYLAAHKFVAGGKPPNPDLSPEGFRGWVRFAGGVTLTFHLVCLTWIFFRAENFAAAWTYLSGIVSNGIFMDFGFRVPIAAFYLGLLALVDFGMWKRDRELPISEDAPPVLRGIVYGLMLVLIFYVGEPDGTPFIYFQF